MEPHTSIHVEVEKEPSIYSHSTLYGCETMYTKAACNRNRPIVILLALNSKLEQSIATSLAHHEIDYTTIHSHSECLELLSSTDAATTEIFLIMACCSFNWYQFSPKDVLDHLNFYFLPINALWIYLVYPCSSPERYQKTLYYFFPPKKRSSPKPLLTAGMHATKNNPSGCQIVLFASMFPYEAFDSGSTIDFAYCEDIRRCAKFVELYTKQPVVLFLYSTTLQQYAEILCFLFTYSEIFALPQLQSVYIIRMDYYCKPTSTLAPHRCIDASDVPQSLFLFSDELTFIERFRNDLTPACEFLRASRAVYYHDATQITFRKETDATNHYRIIQCLMALAETHTAKQEMLEECRKAYPGNPQQQHYIDEFEYTFIQEQAIWWYTRAGFLFNAFNDAFRSENIDQMYAFRYFLAVLNIQLNSEARSCSSSGSLLKLYRGQYISRLEAIQLKEDVGTQYLTTTFFSTSKDRDVAMMYLGPPTEDKVPVEIEIIIDTSLKTTAPFADITGKSSFTDEGEYLFGIGCAFETVAVNESSTDMWFISVTLISYENKFNLLSGLFPMIQMASLLSCKKTGEYYIRLFIEEEEEKDTSSVNVPVGYMFLGKKLMEQEEYQTAADACDTAMQLISSSHLDIDENLLKEFYSMVFDIYSSHLKNPELAIERYSHLANHFPVNSAQKKETHTFLYRFYRSCGDKKAAEEHFLASSLQSDTYQLDFGSRNQSINCKKIINWYRRLCSSWLCRAISYMYWRYINIPVSLAIIAFTVASLFITWFLPWLMFCVVSFYISLIPPSRIHALLCECIYRSLLTLCQKHCLAGRRPPPRLPGLVQFFIRPRHSSSGWFRDYICLNRDFSVRYIIPILTLIFQVALKSYSLAYPLWMLHVVLLCINFATYLAFIIALLVVWIVG